VVYPKKKRIPGNLEVHYAVKDIGIGEEVISENIKCIRPGFGLAPKYFETLIGKKAKGKILRGSPISLDLV